MTGEMKDGVAGYEFLSITGIFAPAKIPRALFSFGSMLLNAGMVGAQGYPSKPVRLVTSSVGGGGDFAARLLAQELYGKLGQRVIVDNRGGGVLAGELVARTTPDGYTLLLYGSTIWLAPFLQETIGYSPVRDFAPVTLAISAPNVLVVHPSLLARTVQELIALAQARPGELNYASGAAGSANHLGAELFKSMARVNIAHINYKGTGAAMSDLLAGQVHIMIANPTSAGLHIKSGRLVALAVTTAEPSMPVHADESSDTHALLVACDRSPRETRTLRPYS